MGSLHLSPDEAVLAHQELGARNSVGIHFGTFRLSKEGQDDPVAELTRARKNRNIDEDVFRTLFPGEAWDIPLLQQR